MYSYGCCESPSSLGPYRGAYLRPSWSIQVWGYEMQNESLGGDDVTSEFDGAASVGIEAAQRFKLRVSIPSKNFGPHWLCRATGDALAYQNYCATGGTPRVFRWLYGRDQKTYLQDQEENFLSWERTANCLYMASGINAAAWTVEGKRLIRLSDGAVLSRPEDQHWPLATGTYLMALQPGEWAMDVEIVEETG